MFVAVLVPGKFLYLATPHTGSVSVARTLLENVEDAASVGSHHATHDDVADRLHGERLVTGVRNPYDLVVSWWTRTYAQSRWSSFHDFVREWDEPVYVKDGRMFHHWKPGVQVLRFEELQEDFDTLLRRYRLPHVTLLHENRSNHRHPWSECYDAESYALVNERFRAEIVAFGYEMRS